MHVTYDRNGLWRDAALDVTCRCGAVCAGHVTPITWCVEGACSRCMSGDRTRLPGFFLEVSQRYPFHSASNSFHDVSHLYPSHRHAEIFSFEISWNENVYYFVSYKFGKVKGKS